MDFSDSCRLLTNARTIKTVCTGDTEPSVALKAMILSGYFAQSRRKPTRSLSQRAVNYTRKSAVKISTSLWVCNKHPGIC